MIAVVQRVTRAEVRVSAREPAAIGGGLLILLGVARGDTRADAEWLARKCLTLRIFDDSGGHMNLPLEAVGGELLVVSQFTLLGDCVKGRRPSWSRAGDPEQARGLYEHFVALLRRSPFPVATGLFQARMEVEAVNAGPVTLILDSHDGKGRPETRGAQRPTLHGAGAPSPAAAALAPDTAVAPALLRRGREPLVLASRSPRRAALLRMLGVAYTVRPPEHVEEGCAPGEAPATYAERQAEAKARAVAEGLGEGVVLGADTVVHLDGVVLEKPADGAEAAAYLRRLSGRTHEVFSGISLAGAGGARVVTAVERSRVRMSPLDEATIAAYVASGEPLDKAGAYGIQGLGGLLVEAVEGCYFNVMGLPLARLRALFREYESLEPPVAEGGEGAPR